MVRKKSQALKFEQSMLRPPNQLISAWIKPTIATRPGGLIDEDLADEVSGFAITRDEATLPWLNRTLITLLRVTLEMHRTTAALLQAISLDFIEE